VRGRGFAGALERSWSGEPGTIPWTLALLPFAGAYAIASRVARSRAASTRTPAAGMHVVAVGNLTVGGTGKSSIARWLAGEVAAAGGRGALLLRGHGARVAEAPSVVPDFAGYPLASAAARCGDEALAHRAALPRSVAVVVDPDRARAASAAGRGYGATVSILDDGWEQRRLSWSELWVTLDPSRPIGNGWPLPAGPLRRPPRTLASATVVAFLLESEEEQVSDQASALVSRFAPRAAVLRFRRALRGLSAVGDPRVSPWPGAGFAAAGLVTAVGAPARVERFARAAGIPIAGHEAFPDHAAATPDRLRASFERLRARGASVALVTEKDEHRWVFPSPSPLPVRVLRAGVTPLDSVSAHLLPLRRAAGGVC
jgi:tetraacyldisaccharide 4'-kinase